MLFSCFCGRIEHILAQMFAFVKGIIPFLNYYSQRSNGFWQGLKYIARHD